MVVSKAQDNKSLCYFFSVNQYKPSFKTKNTAK